MGENDIRKYAQLMEELNLTGLQIKDDGKELRLERAGNVQAAQIHYDSLSNLISTEGEAVKHEDGLIDVCSPIVGLFYKSAAENGKPFVNVGDKVKKGDVLCVIEAMKLMNEITAEMDGIIAEICVDDKQVVDFGHVLFKIRRSNS